MENADWMTPAPFVEAARDVLGGIDLDPASDAEANRIVKARAYCTAKHDGLAQNWRGCVFLNPPGGLVSEFWIKLLDERAAGRVTQAIWIGYSLEQLQTLQGLGCAPPLDFPICVPSRRIAFVENEAKRAQRIARIIADGERPDASAKKQKAAADCRAGKPPKDSPSHANYITYLGPNPSRFLVVFGSFGRVRV